MVVGLRYVKRTRSLGGARWVGGYSGTGSDGVGGVYVNDGRVVCDLGGLGRRYLTGDVRLGLGSAVAETPDLEPEGTRRVLGEAGRSREVRASREGRVRIMNSPASAHTYPDMFVPVVLPFECSTARHIIVHEHDRCRRLQAGGMYEIRNFGLELGPRARKAEPCTPSRTGMGTEGAGMCMRRPRSVSVEK